MESKQRAAYTRHGFYRRMKTRGPQTDPPRNNGSSYGSLRCCSWLMDMDLLSIPKWQLFLHPQDFKLVLGISVTQDQSWLAKQSGCTLTRVTKTKKSQVLSRASQVTIKKECIPIPLAWCLESSSVAIFPTLFKM